MIDSNASIKVFLQATASREPTPGGGAVAALCGALAVAIGEMVLNYSASRKINSTQAEAKLIDGLQQFNIVRGMFLELMVEDQSAYEDFSKLRKSNAPVHEISAALSRCITVPRGIAGGALSVLKMANELTPIINRHLRSDLSVCGELAMATLRSSLHCVRINLPELDDPNEIRRLTNEADHLLKQGIEQVKKLEGNVALLS